MKQRIVFLFVLLTALFAIFTFSIINSKIRGPYASIIQQGAGFYTTESVQNFRPDEYWLMQKVADKTGAISPAALIYLRNIYQNSLYYKRYIDENAYDSHLRFVRHMDKVGTFDFYTMPDTQDSLGTWDRVYVKAMYCDKTGYDDLDFKTLSSVLKNKSGYYDTHYLLYLLFLKEFHCYKTDLVEKEIANTAVALIKEESMDHEFSDLYAERIVFLYWAGYGKAVKREWVDQVAKNFHKDRGWNDKGVTTFQGHPTGLSLLSLIYFTEGKSQQTLF